MRNRVHLILLLLSVFSLYPQIVSAGLILPSHNAVLFQQLDFRGPFSNSTVAEVTINIASANLATGLDSGFINIANGTGSWLVRNLPVFGMSIYNHPTITTSLDLGVSNGTNVSALDVYVDYSSTPVTTFAGGPPSTFGVGSDVFAVGGFVSSVTGYLGAPDVSLITFTTDGLLDVVYQKGHVNLEAADDQCAPMAIANSFQWLEDNTFLDIPHDHEVGLKGDGSLVGQLDNTMDRGVTDRRTGAPLGADPILEGKLEYISTNGLGPVFDVKHQGMLGESDFSRHGLTSKGKGAAIDFDFIFKELSKGENVELGYLSSAGGHFVDVTGAGRILGVPWITYVSDHDQTDDANGTGKVDFSFLSGTMLVNEKDTPNMAFVTSQSAVPEPSTFTVFGFGTVAFIGYGYRARGRKRSATGKNA